MIPGTAAKLIFERLLSEITDENGEVLLAQFPDHDSIDPKIEALKEVMRNLPVRFDKLISCIENDTDLGNLNRRVRLVALADYCRAALGLVEAEIVKSERQTGDSS